jgi:nitrogen fixation NifU-like protein
MMMDLRDLYQDVILDHGRHPRNFRTIAAATHFAHGHNPLCGDKLTVFLRVEDGRIADVSFEGRGCAISTASASLMTEVLKGKTGPEARRLFEAFHARVTTGEAVEVGAALEDEADRLTPLTGVRTYPARVKCATLAWHTVDAAMRGGQVAEPVATE